MRLVVQDANIIIDHIECDLFERFFRLDVQVVTTSLVLGEITEPSQRERCEAVIRKKWLQVKDISTIDYLRLQALDLPGLSVPDRSVLELVEALQGSLLTGDGKLRKTAIEHNMDVRGILLIFDQLVEEDLLNSDDAHKKLKHLKLRNPRLPQQEIERRLKAWSR